MAEERALRLLIAPFQNGGGGYSHEGQAHGGMRWVSELNGHPGQCAPDHPTHDARSGAGVLPGRAVTCPFCEVALLRFHRQGERTPCWQGCPCCGCMWLGRIDPANQVHPLAWVPACLHAIPREAVA